MRVLTKGRSFVGAERRVGDPDCRGGVGMFFSPGATAASEFGATSHRPRILKNFPYLVAFYVWF